MSVATSTAAAPDLARAHRRATLARFAACMPALGLVLLIVIVPVGWLFFLSFRDAQGFTLHHYGRMLANPGYAASLETTLLVSGAVTLATAILAFPVAYWLATLDPRRARLLMLVVLVPLWTALLVRTFAWLVLLQRTGPVNNALLGLGLIATPLALVDNFTGTVIGMTHIMLPFMVLPLLAAMRGVDRRLLWAAESLGASKLRAFWGIFFPLAAPGLLAGAVLIFVMSLGFYVIPAFLGGGRILMWSMKIVSNINIYSDWGAASALGVVLLLVALAVLWCCRRLVQAAMRQGG
jgi:ABC-type spermidine/putrescine transport system permease subunit I